MTLPLRQILSTMCWRACLFLAAVLFAASGTASPTWARDMPGQFDFYVLSLSWSPTHCEALGQRAAKEAQCSRSRPYGFVVHGLWPQHERGFPESCQVPPPYVRNDVLRTVEGVIPSRGLAIHQWKKHGTCSGLNAREYFDTLRAARNKVVIPPQFVGLRDYRMASPAEVEAAFLASNPGLRHDMISVTCDRRRLREVRICFSRNLGFRSCPDVDRRSCNLSKMVLPPLR